MPTYHVTGNVVSREEEPRFRVVMKTDGDVPAQPADIEWIDEEPRDLYLLTGYLREAVKAWHESRGEIK